MNVHVNFLPQRSVVAPVYNEEQVLPAFHQRISAALDSWGMSVDVVYVNDGSRDGSMALAAVMQSRDGQITVLDLSGNFGNEIAMRAGLD